MENECRLVLLKQEDVMKRVRWKEILNVIGFHS